MFTGIVEDIGKVREVIQEGNNRHFWIASKITKELQVDQSVSHNGVCLTIVDIKENVYKVTAVDETLKKSNLGKLQKDDKLNLERSLSLQKLLDGHMVQGHVDTIAECLSVTDEAGSWIFKFKVDPAFDNLMVEKGSICLNGTSLTIFNVTESSFEVAIIPYTYEHTIFHELSAGMQVNVEFDIMGKYVMKYLQKLKLGNAL